MHSSAKLILLFCLILLTWSGEAKIERSVLTTFIDNREPVDDLGNVVIDDHSNMQQIYFFTQVKQLQGNQIVHRWFYRDREMAAVTLEIGSQNWRTFSSKRLRSQWLGNWRVEVWQGDIKMLEHRFEYQTE